MGRLGQKHCGALAAGVMLAEEKRGRPETVGVFELNGTKYLLHLEVFFSLKDNPAALPIGRSILSKASRYIFQLIFTGMYDIEG